VGPARADLYLGAGAEAGRVSGRFRHNMRFVILVPKSLDPLARGRKMPVPDPRPSAKIAKLFPQIDPLKDHPKDPKDGAKPPETSAAAGPTAKTNEPAKNAVAAQPTATVAQNAPAATAIAKPVPLPEARPNIKPVRDVYRRRTIRRYRRGR
jgi:membrane-bound lytic murein transglycosylase A